MYILAKHACWRLDRLCTRSCLDFGPDLAEKAFRDGIERWRVKVNDTLMRAFVRCVGTERASVVCHQLGLNPAILHRIAGSSGMSTSHLVLSCLCSCFSGRMIITIFNFICIS